MFRIQALGTYGCEFPHLLSGDNVFLPCQEVMRLDEVIMCVYCPDT